MLETSAVVGNMSGLIISAFLSHFLGFIGPFAAVGGISILLTIFMNQLVDFVKTDPKKEESIDDKLKNIEENQLVTPIAGGQFI